MRLKNFCLLVLIGATGRAGDRGKILDYRLYDSGQVKAIAEVEYEGDWQSRLKNEYFKNGRLKRSEWSRHGKPWMVVDFYESGQLKSEERFWGNEIIFGAYYHEDGTVIREVGEKVNWREKADS